MTKCVSIDVPVFMGGWAQIFIESYRNKNLEGHFILLLKNVDKYLFFISF